MTRIEVARWDVVVLEWDGPEPEAADVLATLGAPEADAAKVDIFPAEKIAPVGFDTFLVEGHGVDPEAVAARKADLDAISGIVVVIPAHAFEERRARLEVAAPARHVATLREAGAPQGMAPPLASEGAKGNLGGGPAKAPKSDARISGMVALGVLLFLAIFVIAFVLMAG